VRHVLLTALISFLKNLNGTSAFKNSLLCHKFEHKTQSIITSSTNKRSNCFHKKLHSLLSFKKWGKMIHCNEKINDLSTKRIFSCNVTSDVARPLTACLHDQNKSGFLEGWLFPVNQSFLNTLNCSDRLDKSLPSKKALLFWSCK